MKKNFTKSGATNEGFTLIEIIVSLAVFVVVAVIAVGAFLKILDANKQSQSLETAMTNANFALDSMVRDMRVGYNYTCYDVKTSSGITSLGSKNSCTLGSLSQIPTIAFYSSQTPSDWSSDCQYPPIHIYRYNPSPSDGTAGRIEKAEQASCGASVGSDGTGNGAFVPLTSSGFKILSFNLAVDANTGVQPEAFIYMKASAGSTVQNQTVFTVQTSVSERIMNGN
jgi:prepilin-type N-terminal cleavage/methylation domain-containing protein